MVRHYNAVCPHRSCFHANRAQHCNRRVSWVWLHGQTVSSYHCVLLHTFRADLNKRGWHPPLPLLCFISLQGINIIPSIDSKLWCKNSYGYGMQCLWYDDALSKTWLFSFSHTVLAWLLRSTMYVYTLCHNRSMAHVLQETTAAVGGDNRK